MSLMRSAENFEDSADIGLAYFDEPKSYEEVLYSALARGPESGLSSIPLDRSGRRYQNIDGSLCHSEQFVALLVRVRLERVRSFWKACGILLRPVDAENAYERVGYFDIDLFDCSKKLYEEGHQPWTKQTLTLV